MSCLVSSASVTAKFVAVKVIADVPQRRKLHARSACAGVPRNSNDAIHKECQLVRSCPISPHNFGMGSSRPAPMVLNALSVGCVLADSINALFFRNCVSFGLLALECPGVSEMFQEGQRARVSFQDFSIENVETGTKLTAV